MQQKLSATEFVTKIRNASTWVVETALTGEKVLHALERDETGQKAIVKTYLAPKPIDMTPCDYDAFLASLREVIEHGNTQTYDR